MIKKIEDLTKLEAYNYHNIQALFVIAFFFVLPFFHKFSNLILLVLFLFSVIELLKKRQRPNISVHWFSLLLFLYYFFSELLTGGDWSSIEKRLLLFFIPVTFILTSRLYEREFKPRIYLAYILGNVLATGICLLRATFRSVTIDHGKWIIEPRVNADNYDFLTSSVMGGNFFFGTEFSFFQHPTYASIYIILAQYFVFELIKTESTKRKKNLLFAYYIFFLITLFLLSSKAALITSILLSFWILFDWYKRISTRLAGLAIFATISSLLLFYNPRFKVFLNTLETRQIINPNARFGHDLRILSWDASLSVIRNNWTFGVGEANKDETLKKVYEAKNYIVPAALMLNSHNQYLDVWIGGGLIGIGLLLAGLVSTTVRAIKEKNHALNAFLFIFSFNCLFENLLSRHGGVLFFAVFIAYLTQKNKIEPNNLKHT